MSDSLITKKAIAAGLKELIKTKSFEKITVSDITEICGLNRQTFYYHFQDKYELVNWIYYNETIVCVIHDLSYENWDEKVKQMLTLMKNEDYFYVNTLKVSVENDFKEYLFRITVELFTDIVQTITVHEKMNEEEIKFIAEFYSYGIVGIIISWAQHGMKETPEYITEHLKNLVNGTERFAMMRYLMKNANTVDGLTLPAKRGKK